MEIVIKTPTKAIINNPSPSELVTLRKELTFENTSVKYLLSKHKQNFYLKRRNPVFWDERLKELEDGVTECLLKQDRSGYWIYPGSIPYISTDHSVKNEIQYIDFKPMSWSSPLEFEPYYYQSESVEKLMKEKHGNISVPTGGGKTALMVLLTKNTGLNTVIVTPSKSIFNELLNEFEKRLGKKYVGGYGDGKKDIKKKITIAVGKSLTLLKKGTEAYRFFENKQTLIVDESHVWGADKLSDVCHGVLDNVPYRFFCSATQVRGDGTLKLLQSIIGKTVFEMSLEEAINNKFLCPLKFTILKVDPQQKEVIKDPLESKRKNFLYNSNIAKIYANIANASWNAKQESTLILVEELRQIELIIPFLTVPFTYIHSGAKAEALAFGLNKVDLQQELDKFNKGEVKVLIGTKAISTGTNIYPTHNTCNWMGGGSEVVTMQGAMGRSTRKLELSKFKDFHNPKPFSRIFDVAINNQPYLNNQLKKRIEFYKESGGEIKFV